MNKVYCPILSIGFNAPEKGELDPRLCMDDCAWYNEVERKCNISVIAEYMEELDANTSGIAEAVTDVYEYRFDTEVMSQNGPYATNEAGGDIYR